MSGRTSANAGPGCAASQGIIERAREIAAPLAEGMGFEVVDVGYARENSEWNLSVYIDKRGGIHIDDCERLSKELSVAFDAEEIFNRSYNLIVSSPGLDRPLRTEADFIRYEGELLDIDMLPGRLAAGYREEQPAGAGAGAGDGAGAGGKIAKKARGSINPDRISGVLIKSEEGRIYLSDKRGSVFSLSREDIKTVKRAVRF